MVYHGCGEFDSLIRFTKERPENFGVFPSISAQLEDLRQQLEALQVEDAGRLCVLRR